ncbi:MAG: flagellar biosynthetic protein FliO [Rhodobacteraceae bacterium]|nr:flagellar biosynthetic protein FliO [Paracoccaceae bacterium]
MYNWIETTFNVSGGITQAIAVILALAVVLLLFGLFIFILKRLMGASAPQSRNRQPRIAIMDSASVDARRRLLLIRRDNIEHLILVGGPSDVVVEQNIVRNTPLAQARPGQPSPSNMPMPVKAAVAPGPEIPARPDDFLEEQEVAAPAVQARTPVPSAAPLAQPSPPAPQQAAPAPQPAAPVAQPSAPASPSYQAAATPVATPAPPSVSSAAPQRNYSEPAPSRLTATRAAESAPATVQAPTPPAQQATPPKTTPDKPESGGGLGRASDLLRAATQNGFNRAASKPAAPAPASPEVSSPRSTDEGKVDIAAALEAEIQASEPATAPVKAPEVRPAVPAPSAPQESKTASTLKSLARPFTARDRPSYGGTISPPASGPAARAKTALLKPVEQVLPEHKVEPVLVAATLTAASTPQQAPAQEAPAEESTPKPDQPADLGQATADTADENVQMADAQHSSSDVSEPEVTEAIEPADVTADDEARTAASLEEEGATTETQSVAEAAPSRELSLDIGDLLEDVPEASTPAQDKPEASSAAETPADEASADEAEEAQEETASATATVAPSAVASVAAPAPVTSGPVTSSAPPVKAPVRPSAGLGDRNPIEEEMAKILDELGGQSNG